MVPLSKWKRLHRLSDTGAPYDKSESEVHRQIVPNWRSSCTELYPKLFVPSESLTFQNTGQCTTHVQSWLPIQCSYKQAWAYIWMCGEVECAMKGVGGRAKMSANTETRYIIIPRVVSCQSGNHFTSHFRSPFGRPRASGAVHPSTHHKANQRLGNVTGEERPAGCCYGGCIRMTTMQFVCVAPPAEC